MKNAEFDKVVRNIPKNNTAVFKLTSVPKWLAKPSSINYGTLKPLKRGDEVITNNAGRLSPVDIECTYLEFVGYRVR